MPDVPSLAKSQDAPSPLREKAIEYALEGVRIFPCVEGGKAPACEGGFKAATHDLAQIEAWWAENPNYNIGLCPDHVGWFVVDPDEAEGKANWQKLLDEHGEHPPTRTVRTPRGGLHVYFKGSGRSSASKLAPHVDTRGVGGYVLVPPSVVDGKPYEVMQDVDLADAPAWLLEKVGKGNRKAATGTSDAPPPPPVSEIDRSRTVAYLKSLVGQGKVSIAGSGGNNAGYTLLAGAANLCGDVDVLCELVAEHWNPHCQPPWSDDELRTLCANAIKYNQNGAGSEAAGSPSETFKHLIEAEKSRRPVNDNSIDNEPDDDAEEVDESWNELIEDFTGNDPEADAALPEIKFFDPHKQFPKTDDGATVVVYGPWGSGKTFSVLSYGMSFIRAHLDDPQNKPPARVAYAVGEGRHGVRKNRVPAIAKHFGLDFKELRKHWRTVKVPNLTNKRHVKAFVAALSRLFDGQGPTIVVLDTMATASGDVDGNTDAIGKLLTDNGPVGRIKRKLGGPLTIIVDHSGKDVSRGLIGHSSKGGNIDALIRVEHEKGSPDLTHHVEKQRDAEDGFAVDHRVTSVGKALVVTPVGREQQPEKQKRARNTEGWRNKVLDALEWMRVNHMKSCTMRQLYTATTRRAEWCDLPDGGKLPGHQAEELLDKPMTELEAAKFENSARRMRALVQMRKPGRDGKPNGKGPADGRKRNFGTTAVAKLEGDEWVFFPMALAGVNYDGGDDE